jgi:hypothetical protein
VLIAIADRSQGHESLLDCFVSKHGAGCGVRSRRSHSYEQTRKGGKIPHKIRGELFKANGNPWTSANIKLHLSQTSDCSTLFNCALPIAPLWVR